MIGTLPLVAALQTAPAIAIRTPTTLARPKRYDLGAASQAQALGSSRCHRHSARRAKQSHKLTQSYQ